LRIVKRFLKKFRKKRIKELTIKRVLRGRFNQRFAKKLGGFWEFSGRILGIAGKS
jgi:hypothetical protein